MSGNIHLDPANRLPITADHRAALEEVLQRRAIPPVQDRLLLREESPSLLENIFGCVVGFFQFVCTTLAGCLKGICERLFPSQDEVVRPLQRGERVNAERRLGPTITGEINRWADENYCFSGFQFPCKIVFAFRIFQNESAAHPLLGLHFTRHYETKNLEVYRQDLKIYRELINTELERRNITIQNQNKIQMALVASHKIPGQDLWNTVVADREFTSSGRTGGVTQSTKATAQYVTALCTTTPGLSPEMAADLFDNPPAAQPIQPQQQV